MANINSTESITHHFDILTKDLGAIRAILDAAKVLTALERAQTTPENGTPATGEGYADGHVLCDDTLPTMLQHAAELAQLADNEADCLREVAMEAAKARA